ATTRSVTYSSEVVPVECRIRSSRPRTAPWASAMSWPVSGGGWTSVPVMVSLLVMGWGGCARCRRGAGCVARRGRRSARCAGRGGGRPRPRGVGGDGVVTCHNSLPATAFPGATADTVHEYNKHGNYIVIARRVQQSILVVSRTAGHNPDGCWLLARGQGWMFPSMTVTCSG